MINWLGFIITIIILISISRINLGLSLILGSLTLGIFTLPIPKILTIISQVLTDPSVILLTAAITLIPIIAGILQVSGQFDHIVENLRVGKKGFLGLTPALLGVLPIPGGALFSSPLVEKVGGSLSRGVKVGINIWFRHILYFVYPLTPALIIPARIAGLSVYTVIKYLVPFFLLSILIGYFFFLRKVEGSIDYEKDFDLKALTVPLSVLLAAPIIDFSLQTIFNLPIEEISTFLGIGTSLLIAIGVTKNVRSIFKKSIKKMSPWNFTIIMLGIFIFINIFEASNIGNMIAALSPSKLVLSVFFGFALGLITGRITLSASILIPIYLASFGYDILPPEIFALTYFSIFLGYVISPIHPCVGLTLKYFDTKMLEYFKIMVLPATIAIITAITAFILII